MSLYNGKSYDEPLNYKAVFITSFIIGTILCSIFGVVGVAKAILTFLLCLIFNPLSIGVLFIGVMVFGILFILYSIRKLYQFVEKLIK